MDSEMERELIRIGEKEKSGAITPEQVSELEIRAILAMYGRGVKKSRDYAFDKVGTIELA
jgi:hypothetical protein